MKSCLGERTKNTEINKKTNMAMKHNCLKLHVINKRNNTFKIFVLYIQMAKKRNIPYSTRVKMQVLHEEGCSYRQIATRCWCRHTTVRMIIKRFQQSGRLKDKHRSGRLRCSTARDNRVLLHLCRTDRKKTAPELKRQWSEQSKVQCITGTVRWATFETWFQVVYCKKGVIDNRKTFVGWRTPSVDTSTLGKDFMAR